MLDNILITGITPLEHYPQCGCTKYYKQCMENCTLHIPCQKPEIESINEIKINICVDQFKIIDSILGPKLIIYGIKVIKIIYTANNTVQSLHSAHWEIPFCEFILLEGMSCQKCIKLVNHVFVGIEDGCIKCFDSKTVEVYILFVLCPQLNTTHKNTNYSSEGGSRNSYEYKYSDYYSNNNNSSPY